MTALTISFQELILRQGKLKAVTGKIKKGTENNLKETLNEIDDIVVDITNKATRRRIEDKLTKGHSKMQANKEVAGTIDEVQSNILKRVKELTSVEKSKSNGNPLTNAEKEEIS